MFFKFWNSLENTCVGVQKRLQHMRFPVNIARFLRTIVFEYLWCLLHCFMVSEALPEHSQGFKLESIAIIELLLILLFQSSPACVSAKLLATSLVAFIIVILIL